MDTSLEVRLAAQQAKALRNVAVERGLTPSFTDDDVDAIVEDEKSSPTDRIRLLTKLRKDVHELLYAPPSRT